MTSSAGTMKRLGGAALLMTFAVFLSRIVGYLREAFVAAKFGAGPHTDAFFAAFTIPDWLNYLVAGGTLSITLLPIYTRHLVAGDERAANRTLSVVSTWVTAIVLVGIAAGEVFAEPISRAFFKHMPAEALAECVHYTRILLPAQLCFVLGGLFSATLYARGHFKAAAFAPLLYNAGIIAGGALLGDRLGPEALAWGALGGAVVGPLLVPAWAALRAGARIIPSLSVRDGGFRTWILQSLPLMIGVSLVTADDWILRYFASGDAGAVSHLNYAKRLVAVPIAVAGQAVGQASMPFFARLFAEGKKEELADTIVRTLRGAGVIAALIGAGMVALAEPTVGVLFRRGAFTAGDVTPTAIYLGIFAASVPLWALQGLVARAFYAAGNTLIPMIAGTLITVATLPIYAGAYHAWGVAGLAVASSLGILCHTVAVFVLVPRVLPELRARRGSLFGGLGRGVLLAVAAGAAAWGLSVLVARAVHTGPLLLDLLRLGAGGTAFVIVTLAGAHVLGVGEVARLTARLRRSRRAPRG